MTNVAPLSLKVKINSKLNEQKTILFFSMNVQIFDAKSVGRCGHAMLMQGPTE